MHKSKIPKTLHYVWLSNDPFPVLNVQCINSWKEQLPGYEWVFWDCERIDSIESKWLKQSIAARKYAFATDYIRIYALYHYGGIYLDADVELIGSPAPFLHHDFFIGFEYNNDLEPAVFGSVANHPLLKDLLSYYSERPFIKNDGQPDTRPLPLIFNEKAEKFGFKPNGQKQFLAKDGIAIYPSEIFSPKNIYFKKIKTTSNTVAIHHFDGSWVQRNWEYRCKQFFHQMLFLLGGKWLHEKVVRHIRSLKKTWGL